MNVLCISSKAGTESSTLPRADIKNEMRRIFTPPIRHRSAHNLQPTANQELNDQRGNQHYSRDLLMMGIVMPKTR